MPGSLKCVCPKSSVFSPLEYAGGQLFTTCATLNRTIDLTLSLPSIDEIPDDAGGLIHIDFMQYLNELNHQITDLGLSSGKVKLNNDLGLIFSFSLDSDGKVVHEIKLVSGVDLAAHFN